MTIVPFVFIASPVSSKDPALISQRIELASKFGAWIQNNENKCPFVAAAHDAALGKHLSQPKSEEWWRANIKHFLHSAESLYVLCLDGWEKSKGVALEIEAAHSLGKTVYYYELIDNSFRRKTIS